MADELTATSARSRDAAGPNPGILALVSLALLVASLAASAVMTGGQTFVSPFSTTDRVVAYYRDNVAAVRLNSLLQFGSAVPLGIYAATVYARQLRLGVRVPGPAIGFFGGISASILLMVSAFITWVLSRPEIAGDASLTHALSFLSFATGGVGFVPSGRRNSRPGPHPGVRSSLARLGGAGHRGSLGTELPLPGDRAPAGTVADRTLRRHPLARCRRLPAPTHPRCRES